MEKSDPCGKPALKKRRGSSRNRQAQQPSNATATSPYDAISDLKFEIIGIDGSIILNAEEGLQQKVYDNAINGHTPSVRTVIKWIQTRDRHRSPDIRVFPQIKYEHKDKNGINEAYLILGIASKTSDYSDSDEDGAPFLELEPWFVREVLTRPKSRKLSSKVLADLKAGTRNPHEVVWPKRAEE